MAESNYQILIEMRETIVDYLQEEKEIRILREKEAIKLRDRITELSRHIAVIKRMFPTNS
jgi:hypothetical protein